MILIRKFQLTPLLASSLHISWKGVHVQTMCKVGALGKPAQLLNHDWQSVRDEIKADVELLYNNPNLYFCNKCPESCQMRGKPWHLDISDFVEEEFNEQLTSFGILNK